MVRATRKYGFEPDYAIPPDETLREVMESLYGNRRMVNTAGCAMPLQEIETIGEQACLPRRSADFLNFEEVL